MSSDQLSRNRPDDASTSSSPATVVSGGSVAASDSFAKVLASRGRREQPKRSPWRLIAMLVVLVGVLGGLFAAGYRPQQLWEEPVEAIPTVAVTRGAVRSYVVESGMIESANNATVRCRVQAVIGTTGSSGGRSGGGGSRGGGSSGGTGGAIAKAVAASSKAASAGKSGTRTFVAKPTIRSFSYSVTPHVALRPALASSLASSSSQSESGGGRDRGGRGGFDQERQGSTVILSILEEGTRVEEGDQVCILDDADFRDALAEQRITVADANSWVDQAESAYRVAQIGMQEYLEGVLPQDRALIENYLEVCRTQFQQQQEDMAWEQEMADRNLRAPSQVRSARLALERGQFAVDDALEMRAQLDDYTAPKIVNELKAKLSAIETDLAAQRASLALEQQRERRLEEAIENCVLYAPRDGIVVYAKESNGWGNVENEIREGTTVRENQPIFEIPDPTKMRVKVRVNESKISLLTEGTPALIRVEAFPDHPLRGEVTEVTVIPTPANGPFSEVRVYFALVDIEQGFEGLRSGMTAKIEFLVEDRQDVPRIPVNAIRWFDSIPFVAIPEAGGKYSWKPVEFGLVDSFFAQVTGGLAEGDRIVADPSVLEPPSRSQRVNAEAASWDVAAIAR